MAIIAIAFVNIIAKSVPKLVSVVFFCYFWVIIYERQINLVYLPFIISFCWFRMGGRRLGRLGERCRMAMLVVELVALVG